MFSGEKTKHILFLSSNILAHKSADPSRIRRVRMIQNQFKDTVILYFEKNIRTSAVRIMQSMYHSRVCIGAYVCIITAARGAEERRLGICGPPSQSLTQAGLPDRAERISTNTSKSVPGPPGAYPSLAGLPDGAEDCRNLIAILK